ncbi:MAG: metal ABC transporter substrate-binding protein [bacterium]|nr:metal ABC transporter substrate-binding protein [bacterium]
MKSLFHTAVLTLCFLLATNVDAKVRIVTTTPDLAAIAEAVGGDLVEVQSIAKGYQDPHYVSAKPSFMRTLNRADLLIYTGLELEVGWLPLLIQGARNPKITPGAPGHLEASGGIRILEVPTGQVDRSMGDIHPDGNPHYLLDPRNGRTVAQTITTRLQELSPDEAETFQQNLNRFQQDLENKIATWEKRLSAARGRQVVTYHKQWEYLADWLGLDIVDHVEDKPGIPPSPRHIANLSEKMKSYAIPVIICSNFIDPKPAQHIAERTGATVLLLPISVGGESDIRTYTDLFETIVKQLEGIFSAS